MISKAPTVCVNPECDKPVRDRTRGSGMYPKYCSIKCRDRYSYLRERDTIRVKMAKYRADFPWCRLTRYGLTLEEAEEVWQRRGFGCAICGSSQRLSFDHCHVTGAARDWLCNSCNAGIGHMGDDPKRLRMAAAYLESHRKAHKRRGNG